MKHGGGSAEYQQVVQDPIKCLMLSQDAAPAIVMTERKLVKQQTLQHLNMCEITYGVDSTAFSYGHCNC